MAAQHNDAMISPVATAMSENEYEDQNTETAQPLIGKARFRKLKQVGAGTYAVVYKGLDLVSGRVVAIKRIKHSDSRDRPWSGLDLSAIREVKALRSLRHPNVVELIDVYRHKHGMYLVLEYLDADLEKVIKDKSVTFSEADVKSWTMMMLRGIAWCHTCWILHRDLKPNNLLIGNDGVLRIADFGLAREFGQPPIQTRPMSVQVVTLWYRAPELLMGARFYCQGVDIWSAGCIFAELMLRTPLVAGRSEIGQLELMFRALGTPTPAEWAGITELPGYMPWVVRPRPPMRQLFTAASDEAIALLEALIMWDPRARLRASDALRHAYFSAFPAPTAPSRLPRRASGERGSGDGHGGGKGRENAYGEVLVRPSAGRLKWARQQS